MRRQNSSATSVPTGAVLAGTLTAMLTWHAQPAQANQHILSIDHFVPHISTVPANEDEQVELFVRERVLAGLNRSGRSISATGKVVLFVHGGSIPSVPDFDLPFPGYNWAEFLAQAGFDVFMMDVTGYGLSPRPTMDDPCNANPAQQAILIPNPLDAPCDPSYPFRLTNSQSEWDEIDTVVDFIRGFRGVDRVSLIGWSAGGPRIGGYASRFPEKVDKLVFFAPVYNRVAPSDPPDVLPLPGFPMTLQTYDGLFGGRWDSEVGCVDQFDPDIRDVIWAEIMAFDPLGASWGSPPFDPDLSPTGGVMRVRTANSWGWNQEFAEQVDAPSLIVVGEFDSILMHSRRLFEDLGTDNKVLIEVDCASHFLVWEHQGDILLEGSKNWLLHGSIRGVRDGTFLFDEDGRLHKQ